MYVVRRETVSASQHLQFPSSNLFLLQDSLAAEIEGTMRKELQMDDPDVEEQRYISFFFFFFPPQYDLIQMLIICNNLKVIHQLHVCVSADCIRSEFSKR